MHLSLIIIDGVIVFDNFMLICTTKLAAATRGDVPSDMMYARSSRRDSAFMHRAAVQRASLSDADRRSVVVLV